MSASQDANAMIDDLMPNTSAEERRRARERLNDYVRLLMRIAERQEADEEVSIRENPGPTV